MTSQTPQSGWPQADGVQEPGGSPAAQQAGYDPYETPAAPETFPASASFSADAAFPPDSINDQPAPFAGFPSSPEEPSARQWSAKEIGGQAWVPEQVPAQRPTEPWQPREAEQAREAPSTQLSWPADEPAAPARQVVPETQTWPAEQPDAWQSGPTADGPYVPAPAVLPVPGIDHGTAATPLPQRDDPPPPMAAAWQSPQPEDADTPAAKSGSWAFSVDESKVASAPPWTPPSRGSDPEPSGTWSPFSAAREEDRDRDFVTQEPAATPAVSAAAAQPASPDEDAASRPGDGAGSARVASATATVPASMRIAPGDIPGQLPKPTPRVYGSSAAAAPVAEDAAPSRSQQAIPPAPVVPSQPARASARVQVPGANVVSSPTPAQQPDEASGPASAVYGRASVEATGSQAAAEPNLAGECPLPQRTPRSGPPIPDQPIATQPAYGQPTPGALVEDGQGMPAHPAEQPVSDVAAAPRRTSQLFEDPMPAATPQPARRQAVFDDLISPAPTAGERTGTVDAAPLNGNHPGSPPPQAPPSPAAGPQMPSVAAPDGFGPPPGAPSSGYVTPFGSDQSASPFGYSGQPADQPGQLFGQPGQPADQPGELFGQPGRPADQPGQAAPGQPFGAVPAQRVGHPAAGADPQQARFDQFKAEPPEAVTPEPKPVRTGLLVIGVVLGCVALLGIAFGMLWGLGKLGGDSTASFKVGDCVRQDNGVAVAAECSTPDAFKIVSSTDSPGKCEDPTQPHVQIEKTVFCLRPAQRTGESSAPPAGQ